MKKRKSILFVCLGNICRSPLAEGIARAACAEAGLVLHLDSAGTQGYHAGAAPDARACAVAREQGLEIGALRARRITAADFDDFDLILAADADNLAWLQARRPQAARAELALLLDWCGAGQGAEVPDPYYGDIEDFRATARLLQSAIPGLLQRLTAQA